jgi:hypothetical protein
MQAKDLLILKNCEALNVLYSRQLFQNGIRPANELRSQRQKKWKILTAMTNAYVRFNLGIHFSYNLIGFFIGTRMMLQIPVAVDMLVLSQI